MPRLFFMMLCIPCLNFMRIQFVVCEISLNQILHFCELWMNKKKSICTKMSKTTDPNWICCMSSCKKGVVILVVNNHFPQTEYFTFHSWNQVNFGTVVFLYLHYHCQHPIFIYVLAGNTSLTYKNDCRLLEKWLYALLNWLCELDFFFIPHGCR